MAESCEYGQGDWTFETAVNCAVCPACAFTFDEDHTDAADPDSYSCPVCAELRLTRENEALKALVQSAQGFQVYRCDECFQVSTLPIKPGHYWDFHFNCYGTGLPFWAAPSGGDDARAS